MKYENARDILPPELLRQIQKHVSGQLIYIPARERRREWGAVSGYRDALLARNQDIRTQFALGESIDDLAGAYQLSCESIKKIVYNRKEAVMMDYAGTLSCCKRWADAGKLEEWVHAYLLSDGDNKEFSEGLKLVDRIFFGPVTMPIRLFTRCAGPEETMRFRIHPGWWEHKMGLITEAVRTCTDLPPLIVHYLIPEGQTEGEFELNDGNHRWEACRQLRIDAFPVILWCHEAELPALLARYGYLMA